MSLIIPLEMIFNLREGRYAIPRGGDADTVDFIRLSIARQRKGSYRTNPILGCMVVHSQHGDELIRRLVIHPERGAIWQHYNRLADVTQGHLLAIMADPWGRAFDYGQRLGNCARCGKELTDARSRWYSIGPECEKHWPSMIDEVNEQRGAFEEMNVA